MKVSELKAQLAEMQDDAEVVIDMDYFPPGHPGDTTRAIHGSRKKEGQAVYESEQVAWIQ